MLAASLLMIGSKRKAAPLGAAFSFVATPALSERWPPPNAGSHARAPQGGCADQRRQIPTPKTSPPSLAPKPRSHQWSRSEATSRLSRLLASQGERQHPACRGDESECGTGLRLMASAFTRIGAAACVGLAPTASISTARDPYPASSARRRVLPGAAESHPVSDSIRIACSGQLSAASCAIANVASSLSAIV